MYMNSQQIVLTLGILYMFSIRNGKYIYAGSIEQGDNKIGIHANIRNYRSTWVLCK